MSKDILKRKLQAVIFEEWCIYLPLTAICKIFLLLCLLHLLLSTSFKCDIYLVYNFLTECGSMFP